MDWLKFKSEVVVILRFNDLGQDEGGLKFWHELDKLASTCCFGFILPGTLFLGTIFKDLCHKYVDYPYFST